MSKVSTENKIKGTQIKAGWLIIWLIGTYLFMCAGFVIADKIRYTEKKEHPIAKG